MAATTPPPSTPAQKRSALIAVLCATVIQATAQVLMKRGTSGFRTDTSLLQVGISIVTNPTLFSAFVLYGLFTATMVWALRHGELSMLYPAMALSYIWVSILSSTMFGESMNPLKIVGIVVIVAGVAVLGLGDRGQAEPSVKGDR